MTLVAAGLGTYSGYNLLSGNEHFYSNYAMPICRQVMDGEQAHLFAINCSKYGLIPWKKTLDSEQILVSLIQMSFYLNQHVTTNAVLNKRVVVFSIEHLIIQLVVLLVLTRMVKPWRVCSESVLVLLKLVQLRLCPSQAIRSQEFLD